MLDFATWLLYAATGRVFIYLWMIFPFPPFIKTPDWLEKLHNCDLCSGFWVYSILAVALQADLFSVFNPITEVATGAITSYLVHVFLIGWKAKHEVITI